MPYLTQETIVLLLDSLDPAIHAIAYKFKFDYEDLRQDTAVLVISQSERIAAIPELRRRAYCAGMVRNHCLNEIKRRRSQEAFLSLDMPLSADSILTLSDVLSDASHDCIDHDRQDYHTSIIHQALSSLPVEEQKYIIAQFGIESYTPRPIPGRHERNDRARHNVCSKAYKRLRRDTNLSSALEVK